MSSSEAGVFSQAELEIERDYRKQVRKLYYKRESDFTSLRAYNDYLEEFESLVEQLIDKVGKAKLPTFMSGSVAAKMATDAFPLFLAHLEQLLGGIPRRPELRQWEEVLRAWRAACRMRGSR